MSVSIVLAIHYGTDQAELDQAVPESTGAQQTEVNQTELPDSPAAAASEE